MTKDDLNQEDSVAFRKSLKEHFGELEDYRRQKSVAHRLLDILFITICAVISGANDLKAVAVYAQRKQHWLIDVLALKHRVPSYTTFWTVFALLSPEALGKCFVQWVQSNIKSQDGRVINIDGKAQRTHVARSAIICRKKVLHIESIS